MHLVEYFSSRTFVCRVSYRCFQQKLLKVSRNVIQRTLANSNSSIMSHLRPPLNYPGAPVSTDQTDHASIISNETICPSKTHTNAFRRLFGKNKI